MKTPPSVFGGLSLSRTVDIVKVEAPHPPRQTWVRYLSGAIVDLRQQPMILRTAGLPAEFSDADWDEFWARKAEGGGIPDVAQVQP